MAIAIGINTKEKENKNKEKTSAVKLVIISLNNEIFFLIFICNLLLILLTFVYFLQF